MSKCTRVGKGMKHARDDKGTELNVCNAQSHTAGCCHASCMVKAGARSPPVAEVHAYLACPTPMQHLTYTKYMNPIQASKLCVVCMVIISAFTAWHRCESCYVWQVAEATVAVDPLAPVPALPLGREVGRQMAQQWRAGEAAYLAGMARVFAQLRKERNTYPGHYAAVRSVYITYLQRPAPLRKTKVRHHMSASSIRLQLLLVLVDSNAV